MLSCLRPALKKRKRFAPESEGTPVGPPPPSSEKKVRFTPGKTLARAFGSADPDVDRTPIELPFHCDGCGNYILTTRMNCAACSDYDLCETCFEALERGEPGRGPRTSTPPPRSSSRTWTRRARRNRRRRIPRGRPAGTTARATTTTRGGYRRARSSGGRPDDPRGRCDDAGPDDRARADRGNPGGGGG